MASTVRIDELKKKFDENPRRYFAPLANEFRKASDIEGRPRAGGALMFIDGGERDAVTRSFMIPHWYQRAAPLKRSNQFALFAATLFVVCW